MAWGYTAIGLVVLPTFAARRDLQLTVKKRLQVLMTLIIVAWSALLIAMASVATSVQQQHVFNSLVLLQIALSPTFIALITILFSYYSYRLEDVLNRSELDAGMETSTKERNEATAESVRRKLRQVRANFRQLFYGQLPGLY